MGLVAHAHTNPEAIAIIDEDRVSTYGGLNCRVNKLAHSLCSLGIVQGDTISILSYNSTEFFEVTQAARKIGVIMVPINYHLTSDEIRYIVDNSDSKVLFFGEQFIERIDQIKSDLTKIIKDGFICIGSSCGKYLEYGEMLASSKESEPPELTEVPGTMIYTSGTTGRPKGVYRPPGNMEENRTMLASTLSALGLFQKDIHLLTSPLYHTAPPFFAGINLMLGGTIVIMDRFDAEKMLALIERHKCTTTHVVPTMFVRILRLPEEVRERYEVHSMRRVIHAAAPCPVDVKLKMIDFFGQDVVWEYYGGTESGVATIVGPDDYLKKKGTVGKAKDNVIVKILDDHGNEMSVGEIGTIYFQLEGMKEFEYYKDPEKTRKTYKGKMFTLGDMGYLDGEGFLFLADRKIDMIIRGGVNIYPAEVESVMYNFPNVLDVCVFGLPDSELGETVKAVVQLQPGTCATEEEILEFCKASLAKYKVPESVDFVDELPRDPNGKLMKKKVKEKYLMRGAR
ncbi:MAG: AMP-binding protein [Thermodesulfobacteriota bacterium]|nr:AMP-binding protein [Thermodesulfobacteriota bacterium]